MGFNPTDEQIDEAARYEAFLENFAWTYGGIKVCPVCNGDEEDDRGDECETCCGLGVVKPDDEDDSIIVEGQASS